MNYTSHYTVMKRDVLAAFKEGCAKGPTLFADLTFGGGGHTLALLDAFPESSVLAVDQDNDALQNGLALIQSHQLEKRLYLYSANFERISEVVQTHFGANFEGFDGIVMDLGVSSHHFDEEERGFSYRSDAPLDMRMDQDSPLTAQMLVNTLEEEELVDIFQNYGEERFAKRIASNIIAERMKREIVTTKDLEDIVFHSYPKEQRYKKTHPATKVFQALRIKVNRELEVLEATLLPAINLLKPSGILAIISFHSLEDRIVKHELRRCDRELGLGSVMTKKPILPSNEELEENRRSRSAKLRLFHKVAV